MKSFDPGYGCEFRVFKCGRAQLFVARADEKTHDETAEVCNVLREATP